MAGMVAEVGAWAGFGAKTPHPKYLLPDFSYEEIDCHLLPDPCPACWKYRIISLGGVAAGNAWVCDGRSKDSD